MALVRGYIAARGNVSWGLAEEMVPIRASQWKPMAGIRVFNGGCQHDAPWARWDQSYLRGHQSALVGVQATVWDPKSLVSLGLLLPYDNVVM